MTEPDFLLIQRRDFEVQSLAAPSTPSRECFTDSSGLCRNPDWCIHSVPEEMVAEISRLTRVRAAMVDRLKAAGLYPEREEYK